MEELNEQSLVSMYEDICCTEAVLHNGLETEFLNFLQQLQVQWLQTKEELKILKQEHEVTVQELGQWRKNFDELKNVLKAEEQKRKEVEAALNDFVQLFNEIKEVVNKDSTLTDQTKECFTKLRNYEQLYSRRESEVVEHSVDFDKSEEVLDFESAVLSWGRKRNSSPCRTLGDNLPAPKQPRLSSENALYATPTSVEVPDNRGSSVAANKLALIRQESVPGTPPLLLSESQRDKRRSRSEPEAIILPEHETRGTEYNPVMILDPNVNQSVPAEILFPSLNRDTPNDTFKSSTPRILNTTSIPVRHNSGSKLNGRAHDFATKTVFKPETCASCSRRIKFSKQALKCHNCHVTCHPECKSSVPLPCVPIDRTPNKVGKTVSDFAPVDPPGVPAIIVMCVHEVEARGMNEAGLYRLSAPEREISGVKEKFFKSKAFPNLKNVGVHVLCATIKDFLRHLEPLIPKLTWKEFAAATAITDPADSQTAMYQCIGQLPLPNRDTLAFLILHWQRIADNPTIKMPVKNLSLVLGPTVVGFSSQNLDPENLVMEQSVQVKVMEKLLMIPADFWNSFLNEQENTPLFHDTSVSSSRNTLLPLSASHLHRVNAVRANPNMRQARLFTSPNP